MAMLWPVLIQGLAGVFLKIPETILLPPILPMQAPRLLKNLFMRWELALLEIRLTANQDISYEVGLKYLGNTVEWVPETESSSF